MTDIVERIRSRPHDAPLPTEYLLDDAADEIERQQADIDKMMSERQGWLDEIESLRAALIQVRGFSSVMAENNWRDLRLHIERQCDVLN